MDPPVAGVAIFETEVVVVVVAELPDPQAATATSNTAAIPTRRNTHMTLGAGSPVASTLCEWDLI